MTLCFHQKTNSHIIDSLLWPVGVVLSSIVCWWITAIPSSCQAQANSTSEAIPVYLQKKLPVDKRIADLIERMGLEEKAQQLSLSAASSVFSGAHVPKSEATAELGAIAVTTDAEIESAGRWAAETQRTGLKIPPLILRTWNHNDDPAASFLVLGATWDQRLVHQVAEGYAARERRLGINALVLPLYLFAGNPQFVGNEYSSASNTWLIEKLATAYIDGLQGAPDKSEHTVAAFPAYFPSSEQNPGSSALQLDERELRMRLLTPFEGALRNGKSFGLIVSGGDVDGVATVMNTTLLQKIVREEWGFTGATLSAPGSIHDLVEVQHRSANPMAAVCEAVNSGIDFQWNDSDTWEFSASIAECVRNGVISMKTLNRAVEHVLRIKFALGLFDEERPNRQSAENASPALPESERRAALESVTLLHNENNLLPLVPQTKSLVVIEPDTDRHGVGKETGISATDAIVTEIHKILPQIRIATIDNTDLAAVAASAKSAEAAIVILQRMESAPAEQESLISTVMASNPRTIVLFERMDLPLLRWAIGHVPAILETWTQGKETASSVAEILTGISSPGGRLPFALTAGNDNLPIANPSGAPPAGARVLLPLGFGLSYTTFHYSRLDAVTPDPGSRDDLKITVTVTNTGRVEGDEVAQLYLHHELSSVATPDRELIGFKRIHLLPGESRALSFKVSQRQLAVWNRKQEWSIEPGPYTIYVGGAADAEQSTTFSMGEPLWARHPSLSTDHWIAAPTLEMKGVPAAEFSEAYELALRVMEYNLRGGVLEAGKGYGTWTRDAAINTWNAASLLMPETARWTLWHQTELTPDGPVVGGQYWDKVIWIIAAYDYARIAGDKAFLTNAYGVAQRTLAEMRATQFDPHTGLYRGPAVYADGVAAYPDPPFNDKHGDNALDYTEGATLEALSTNCTYYGAYRSAAAMGRELGAPEEEIDTLEMQAAKLRGAIQNSLWLRGAKHFAYFRDANGTINATQEALGEALSILLGVAYPEQAHSMIRHASVTPWGIACTWQPYSRYLDPEKKVFGRHNGTIWPFINAFWASAAASINEPKSFATEFIRMTQLSIRSQDFREVYHPYTGVPYGGFQANRTWDSVQHQTWSATGYLRMVYQGLFGMRFEDAGMRLQPFIPPSLGIRSTALRGLHYRNADLTIRVVGTGNRILQCKLDGELRHDSLVPASLTGKHEIEIVLASHPRARIGAHVARTSHSASALLK